MKLSEEIALGRMLLKPVRGIVNDGHGGGCAFGMADAARGTAYCNAVDARKWLTKCQDFITLPCECRGRTVFAGGMELVLRQSCRIYMIGIVHVFNYHVCTVKDWTIDQLIDWIRQIEPAEEEAPAAAEQGRGVLARRGGLVAK